jgi:UDP:flavonoid glycosyltransferase YjiC (YdhE family)
MMRILFTTNPLYGHLLPMLPLINAARAGGHQVMVATAADFAPEIDRHGLPMWAVGPTFAEIQGRLARLQSQPRDEGTGGDSGAAQLERLRQDAIQLFADPGVARARDLVPLAGRWRPDIVVHELAEIAGWEAAAVSGALDVVHGFGTHVPYLIELVELVCAYSAEQLGTPNRSRQLGRTPYVDPCPPSLQPPGESPFADILALRPQTGAVYPGEALPAGFEALPFAETIYLTLGTAFNQPEQLDTALRAVRDLPYNVVVTTGPGTDPAAYGPQPPHVLVVDFVPQALLLEHVSLVVSHTGSGTMLGALAEGLPQVCLPIGADQFANADQIARIGAGQVVLPDVRTPETIRAAIEEVLRDSRYGAAARRAKAEIDEMSSAEEVLADLIDRAATAVTA